MVLLGLQATCIGHDAGWALSESLVDTRNAAACLSAATVVGLLPGQTYQFRVAMRNGIGLSEYSTVHGTTLMAVPSAPRQLHAVATDSTTVALRWLPPASTGGAHMVRYRVEQSLNGSDWEPSVATIAASSDGASDSVWIVSHLQAATEYLFKVFAVSNIGDSAPSVGATATTPSSVPTAPTELQVTNVTSESVDLSFKVTFDGGNMLNGHEIQQRLYRKTTCCDACGRDIGVLAAACTHCSYDVVIESEAAWSVSQTQKLHDASSGRTGTHHTSILDLLAGAVYVFRCRSANTNGFGEWSRPTEPISIDKCAPYPPATFTVDVTGAREVIVSWTMPARTGGWRVERAAFQKLLVRDSCGVEADWSVATVQLADSQSAQELTLAGSDRSMEAPSAAWTSTVDSASTFSAVLSGLQPAAVYYFRMMLERAIGLPFFALRFSIIHLLRVHRIPPRVAALHGAGAACFGHVPFCSMTCSALFHEPHRRNGQSTWPHSAGDSKRGVWPAQLCVWTRADAADDTERASLASARSGSDAGQSWVGRAAE
jgi:hypothetical protein